MSAPQGGIQTARAPGAQNQAGHDPKRGRKKPPSNGQQPRRTGKPPSSNPNVYTRAKGTNPRSDTNRTTYRRPRDGQKPQSSQSNQRNVSNQSNQSSQSGQSNQYQYHNPNSNQLLRRQRPNQKFNLDMYSNGTAPGVSTENSGLLGSLFDDPASYGFLMQPRSQPKRPTPRFMLSQPRMLVTPEFNPNEWDRQNQEKMLQMEQANGGRDYQGIYEDFQKMRDVERKKMEELGLVDAENTTKDLNEAIAFQGTCLDMCPTFERVRRALENNVKNLEKDPSTNKISRERAIKAFSRPAAGQPPLMPSDVRPPHVLQQTLDYIVDNIIEQLPEAHSFIWDRTRSIRQDFIYQNFYGPQAIDCNERIVRIHLLSLHIMAGSDVEYSQQQELEQLNKALQTLTEIYQDVRNHGGSCPNEAEFRAYNLISHFRDPELEREIQTLPDEILQSKQVQLALRFRALMSQNNVIERGYTNAVGALNFFVEFFRLVYSPETPFLLACLLETHFNEYRFYALKSMTRAYHTKGRAFLATSLQDMLGFDSIDKLVAFVQYYEVDTLHEDGVLLIDLFNKEKLETKYKLNCYTDKPKLSQAFSIQLDQKSKGLRLRSYVNSGLSNADLHLQRQSQPIITLVTKKPIKASQASHAADSMASNFGTFGSDTSKATTLQTATGFGQNTVAPPLSGFGLTPSSTFQFGQPPVQPSAGFGGFGLSATGNQNVGSLNLEDFLKSQNGTAKQPQQTEAKPAFSFGQPAEKAVTPVEAPKPAAEPKFNFTKPEPSTVAEKPKVSFGAAVSIPFDSTAQPNKDTGLQPKVIDLKDEKPPLFSSKPAAPTLPKPPTPAVSEIPKFEPKPVSQPLAPPVPTAPSKLVDAAKFPAALKSAFNDILGRAIDEELYKMLPRIIKYENRATERQKLIDGLAGELFRAFVDEVTYESSLRAIADQYEKKIAVRRTLQALRNSYEKKRAKNDQRKQKLEELQSISFKKPTLKRVALASSSVDGSFRKRANYSPRNESFSRMSEKQLAIEDLWKPLDLVHFVDNCTSKVKVSSNKIDLKCLIVVEDWGLAYSKWLNTKFKLQVAEDGQYYKNTISNQSLKVDFESLPSGNALKESSFQQSAFLVFECGLVDNRQAESFGSLRAKLERDGSILHKIFQICSRYCLYKVQILLVLWDVQNVGLSPMEVKQIMRLSEFPKDIVQDVILCDMSSGEDSVAETLNKGMERMSGRFKGKLTARGLKKKAKLEAEIERRRRLQEEEAKKSRTTEEAELTLRQKEADALKRAEQSRQVGYLNKHINNSYDMSNASFRTAANTTRGLNNTTFGNGNQTMLNLNNSFLNHDTSQGARDLSVLGSFGNNVSVLEESTPFGSPRPSISSRGALPKKVNELRELTASIRAKYKKPA